VCGHHPIALAVGRAAQLDALLPENLVLLASRSARTGDLPPRDAVAPGGRDG
jgi:hypothetical protein